MKGADNMSNTIPTDVMNDADMLDALTAFLDAPKNIQDQAIAFLKAAQTQEEQGNEKRL